MPGPGALFRADEIYRSVISSSLQMVRKASQSARKRSGKAGKRTRQAGGGYRAAASAKAAMLEQQLAKALANRPANRPRGPQMMALIQDLTDEEAAEFAYLVSIVYPEWGSKAKIPLLLGGPPAPSVVIQLRTRTTFYARPNGFACFVLFGPIGAAGSEVDNTGAVVPAYLRALPASSLVNPAFYGCGTHKRALVGNPAYVTCPGIGSTVDQGVGNANDMYQGFTWPKTGMDLTKSQGRLISASAKCYGVGTDQNTSGSMLAVRPGFFDVASTQLATSDKLYEDTTNEITDVTLSKFGGGKALWVNYIPSAAEQYYWLDLDGTGNNNGSDHCYAGVPWAVFIATGCQADQPFIIESVFNIELKSSNFRMATLGSSAIGAALPTSAKVSTRPSFATETARQSNAAETLAIHGTSAYGERAKSILGMIGNGLLSVAEAAIPALATAFGGPAAGALAAAGVGLGDRAVRGMLTSGSAAPARRSAPPLTLTMGGTPLARMNKYERIPVPRAFSTPGGPVPDETGSPDYGSHPSGQGVLKPVAPDPGRPPVVAATPDPSPGKGSCPDHTVTCRVFRCAECVKGGIVHQ